MPTSIMNGSFAGGEVSPSLYGRTDISRYQISLRRCRNFVVHPQGGVSNRPGTYYVATTKTSSSRTRVIKFIFNENQAYVLEFGDQYVRFYTDNEQIANGGVAYEVATPYIENDLDQLRFESSADVMYITHPDYQTMTLSRFGNADWSLDYYVSDDGPFMNINTNESISVNASAITGDGITLTATSTDTTTKLLMHFDGVDTDIDFVEDTNKIVTNNTTYDSFTKLMLHFDNATNNASVFTDEIGKLVTRGGTAVTKTSVKKFGVASLYLSASANDYIELADSADWDLGSSNFTIETWFRLTSLPSAGQRYVLFSQQEIFGVDNLNGFRCNLFQGGNIDFSTFNGTDYLLLSSASGLLAVDTWYHLAVVRNGTSWVMYLNGTSIASTTATRTCNAASAPLQIGRGSDTTSVYYFDGYMDEFRYSRGVARWTTTFTPPTRQYGYVTVTTAESKFGGSSAKFEGDSFLSIPDSDDFSFGTGDLTIDFWVKFNSISPCCFYSQSLNAANTLFIEASGTTMNFSAVSGGVNVLRFNFPYVPSGNWEHIMLSRSSGTWHAYIDGLEKVKTLDAGAYAASLPNIGAILRIGSPEGTTKFFNGWMGELRVLKGEADETGSSFTVPTSAYFLDSVFTPLHEGALFKLRHYVGGQAVYTSFGSATTGSAIKCFTTWRIITHGTWTGTVDIEKSTDGGTTWTKLRTYSSANDLNINTFGTEDIETHPVPFYIRLKMSSYTSGTCNADLTSDPFYQEGIVRITDFLTSTTVNGDVIQEIASTSQTTEWQEGSWSDYRGWPSVARFIQDRLAFSATYSEPMTTWMSQIGNYVSFARHTTLLDSDAITVNLPSRQLNAINGLVSLRKLIALTLSSEWTVGAISGSALTPTTTEQLVQGYRGSSGIDPELIGNECIFCQSNGQVIRNLSYQFSSDAFVGSDLNVLARHLFLGHTIIEIAYQQDPDSILWCLRDDGVLLGLTYMAEQEVIAWSWHDTNGLIESICCIPNNGHDELWMVVNRDNGRFIEYMAPRMYFNTSGEVELEQQNFLDSAIKFAPGDSITAPHLAGHTVNILEGGIPLGEETCNSGAVSVTLSSATVIVGLPYSPEIETLNIDTANKAGTIQGRKVKISNVTFRVVDTIGGWIGPDSNNLYEAFPDAISAEGITLPTALFSGDIRMTLGAGYESGGRVFFRQVDPSPVTINAIIPEVNVGDSTG